MVSKGRYKKWQYWSMSLSRLAKVNNRHYSGSEEYLTIVRVFLNSLALMVRKLYFPGLCLNYSVRLFII